MSNPTTPFGWQMPTATDLVTDLPADFEVFGQAVATSMADLLGGTSGQILAKNSNTDMDFVWVTNDVGDITAVTAGTGISGGGTSGAVTITNSMATEITAKGDLIVGTGSATFDNIAAGNNGETLVADSAATTGLRYIGNYAAGKNTLINGDYGVWQRGTSITIPNGAWTFAADRWQAYMTYSAGSCTVSRQTFTPGTAPVAGYEGQYFLRATAPTTGTSSLNFRQLIENVQTFAGQTMTVSFWAKASASTSMAGTIRQNFGSGGSASVDTYWSNFTITTSWQRFTQTFSVPSISGKTIGTGSALEIYPYGNNNFTAGATIDFWGFQAEAGSVATAFQTATGTIQGELAACQRYYWQTQYNASGATTIMASGIGTSSTGVAQVYCAHPVTMRAIPSASLNGTSNLVFYNGAGGGSTFAISAIIGQNSSTTSGTLNFTSTGITANVIYNLIALTGGYGYIAFSSEL